MQNRNYFDPEEYDDMRNQRPDNERGNGNEGFYNPMPNERNTYEGMHHPHRNPNNFPDRSGYVPYENDYRESEYENRRHPQRPSYTTGYNRAVLDRFGNGRRGESIARGNYGLPGTDRFGNIWYDDPRNRGNFAPYPTEDPDRGLVQQLGDEIRSWFGNKEASRRRELDSRNSLGTAWHGDAPRADGYYDDERDREWARNRPYDNRW